MELLFLNFKVLPFSLETFLNNVGSAEQSLTKLAHDLVLDFLGLDFGGLLFETAHILEEGVQVVVLNKRG